KLSTIEANIYCIPSTDNRLLIAVSSCSPGWVKLTSKAETIAENTITSRARLTNSINGSGSRLQIHSTLHNNWDMNFLDGLVDCVVIQRLLSPRFSTA